MISASPRSRLSLSTHSSRVCKRSPSTVPIVCAQIPCDSGTLASVELSWCTGSIPPSSRIASSPAATNSTCPSGTSLPLAGLRPIRSTSMRVCSFRCSSTSATNLPYMVSRHFSDAERYSTSTDALSAIELIDVPPTKRPTLTVVLAEVGRLVAYRSSMKEHSASMAFSCPKSSHEWPPSVAHRTRQRCEPTALVMCMPRYRSKLVKSRTRTRLAFKDEKSVRVPSRLPSPSSHEFATT